MTIYKNIPSNIIEKLYNEFVKVNYTDEYKNRYLDLPVNKNNKKWRWEGKDFPRVISLLEFERYIEKYQFNIDSLLIFNGPDDPEIEYLDGRVKRIYEANFDADPDKFDLHTLDMPQKDFDFVCLHQTLEHVYNPHQCLANIKSHMRDGGYLYINVPACNAPHSEPYHFYTGFTPMGLAAIAYQTGYKILEIGQWGNAEYLVKLWTRNPGWSDYTQLKTPGVNETDNPVITWCLLQK